MRLILCTLALLLSGASSASADVTFCNKTASKLQFAIAHAVTKPYASKEISGWHTIEAGACAKLLQGNFLNQQIYYAIVYADGSREWMTKGSTATYPFCVRNEAFVRHGAFKKLQYDCPANWSARQFYAVVVESADGMLNFFD